LSIKTSFSVKWLSKEETPIYIRPIISAVCIALVTGIAPAMAQQEISLWGEQAPAHSLPTADEEILVENCWGGVRCLHKVSRPTLTIHLPAGKGNGKAVLVMPGGGYGAVAAFHEGADIAVKLAASGTTAVVLKYRLPNSKTSTTPWKVPLSDLHEAMRVLRTQQESLGFRAELIGVMGFSASGHLAAYASVHPVEEAKLNPDFAMLIYQAVKTTPVNLKWLEESLYYRKMTDAELAEQTLLDHVDEHTPPAFLVHAMDDKVCHYTESRCTPRR